MTMTASRYKFMSLFVGLGLLTALILFLVPGTGPGKEVLGYPGPKPVMLFGVAVDFILFACTLLGVALFHNKTLQVALTGLAAVTTYKVLFVGFKTAPGIAGLFGHLGHEWVVLTNLFGLLMGFALLSDHFERSHVPEILPSYLKGGVVGAFSLLAIVFVLSSFLDNIAAALIGGTIANIVFNRKVHIGYIAAIVAASNAGGAGSVVGDTTTTMMWIAGISPAAVFHAYVASAASLVVVGYFASVQQNAYNPLTMSGTHHDKVDGARLGIVFFILTMAVGANIMANMVFVGLADHWPVLGIAVWIALLVSSPLRQPNWSLLPETLKGSMFLLSLVTIASMMPVETLPPASWQSAFTLGFVSAVFDNIPLTALAISQGGYDWGMLAYCVGFGGSMIWFGSSAGVAISNIFPEAKSVGNWLRHGWHVTLAYVVGFLVLLGLLGWHPLVAGQSKTTQPVIAEQSQPVVTEAFMVAQLFVNK